MKGEDSEEREGFAEPKNLSGERGVRATAINPRDAWVGVKEDGQTGIEAFRVEHGRGAEQGEMAE